MMGRARMPGAARRFGDTAVLISRTCGAFKKGAACRDISPIGRILGTLLTSRDMNQPPISANVLPVREKPQKKLWTKPYLGRVLISSRGELRVDLRRLAL